jgi:hypothetical protein
MHALTPRNKAPCTHKYSLLLCMHAAICIYKATVTFQGSKKDFEMKVLAVLVGVMSWCLF